MNILFCGDRDTEDGLIIAVISLLRSTDEPLHIYIFTMKMASKTKQCFPVTARTAEYLDRRVKEKDPENFVKRMDLTDMFLNELPVANMGSRFTPYCMLRLFADEIPEIPDRLLYLDTDIICRQSPKDFYEQDMDGYEIAGVLDHYGKWVFRTNPFHMDYINSGVLLLNMEMIRQTHLFRRCRNMCRQKQMFMPDQSALNKLARGKKICDRKYNEQGKLHKDTVIQHLATTLHAFPVPHYLTVKPWQIERMHRKLKIYEYDDILDEYLQVKSEIEGL